MNERITVKQAAAMIGASEQFVRVGLQTGTLPIGAAVKMGKKNYTYHISAGLLARYMGKCDEQNIEGEENN